MKTILVIEDNKDVRENTSEILELANYKVLQAENGKQGVELAQNAKPDLIICDIMMPELDGYGVLHMLSRNDETASIPFIFLTANADAATLERAKATNPPAFLVKPFTKDDLYTAIEICFNSLVKFKQIICILSKKVIFKAVRCL